MLFERDVNIATLPRVLPLKVIFGDLSLRYIKSYALGKKPYTPYLTTNGSITNLRYRSGCESFNLRKGARWLGHAPVLTSKFIARASDSLIKGNRDMVLLIVLRSSDV